jgi:hypothetical protein
MSDINEGGPAFPISVLGETLVGQEGMTLRQYAAIKLKVPDSGTDWLDGMILESLRNDFAVKAMANLPLNYERMASHAYQMADVMIKARGLK